MAPKKKLSDEQVVTDKVITIDQSQNGTENYRIQVKDVLIVAAPPATLFPVALLLDRLQELRKPENIVLVVNENELNSTISNGNKDNDQKNR